MNRTETLMTEILALTHDLSMPTESLRFQIGKRAVEYLNSDQVKISLEANRFYRLMNGLDEDDHDKRAEKFTAEFLDGLFVGPNNRTTVKSELAEHFEAVHAAARRQAMEHCAQLAESEIRWGAAATLQAIATAIRKEAAQP